MDRRLFLRGAAGLAAVTVSGSLLAACSGGPPTGAEKGDDVETIRYGSDESQFLELSRPSGNGAPKGVVVVVHGGFWLSQYDLSLGRPLATDLAKRGWVAANLEYRRLGNGGGWPETFDDVLAGIEKLADVDGLDTSTLITLGHSAGGHLGVWAAGQDLSVPVTGAVSQAGVLDLATAVREGLGGGAASQLIGSSSNLTAADPMSAIPLRIPVRCVHGGNDSNVPLSQSTAYVDKATSAGADATLTKVDGDHFTLIDPSSDAWRTTVGLLDALV